MSIKNIGNKKWKIAVTKRIPQLASGQKKVTATVIGSKLDAQNKENELKNKLKTFAEALKEQNKRSLKYQSKERLTTFGEAYELWYEAGKCWKKGYGTRLYEHLFNSKLTGNIDEVGIWDDLRRFVQYMEEEATYSSGAKTGLPYSPATINRHISMAQSVINYASCELKRIDRHFLARFPKLPEDNIYKRVLSNSERERLFCHLPDYLKPFTYMAMRVPARISELVNLTVDQIDYDNMVFDLQGSDTKNGEGRWLPIYEEMEEYILSIPPEQKFVFVKELGSPIPLGYYNANEGKYFFSEYDMWNNALENAGIENYNFHKTRQQAARQMLSDGFTEVDTMLVGGWKTFAAFHRYVTSDSIELQKKFRKRKVDDSWKVRLAPKMIEL